MKIGEKIRGLRKELGMTQSALSGEVMTRNMLSLIETGKSNPSLEMLRYIAERLQVSPGWLIDENQSIYTLKRDNALPVIKAAFRNGEYENCVTYCADILDNGDDDEIMNISAECSFRSGKAYLAAGCYGKAAKAFAKVMICARRSLTMSEALRDEASRCLRYANRFKESLAIGKMPVDADSDIAAEGTSDLYSTLCVVIKLLDRDGAAAAESITGTIPEGPYREYSEIKISLKKSGGYDSALLERMTELLYSEELPVEITFLLCSEIEAYINKYTDEIENTSYKLAYTCAAKKLEIIKRAGNEP